MKAGFIDVLVTLEASRVPAVSEGPTMRPPSIFAATLITLFALGAEPGASAPQPSASAGALILVAEDSSASSGAGGDQWDTTCVEKGCLIFKDVLRGDPDHPPDPADPEFITIAVAIERSTKRAAFFAFHVPPNADPGQGVFITFSKTLKRNEARCSGDSAPASCYDLKLDEEGPRRMAFESCSEESCVGRVVGGILEDEEGHRTDLMDKFLTRDHVLFLYMREHEAYRAMEVLAPFKMSYERVLKRLESE